jgi:surface antigen
MCPMSSGQKQSQLGTPGVDTPTECEAVDMPKTRIASRRALRHGRHPLIVSITMVITCGLVVAAGLPANASAFEAAEVIVTPPAAPMEMQTVVVDGSASVSDNARSAFSATTTAELAEQKASAARALADAQRAAQRASVYRGSNSGGGGGGSGSRIAVQPGANDYPWADGPTSGFSPLRYVYRQCVDFVAWRLNRDAGSYQAPFAYDWSDLTPGGGDGRQWLGAWKKHGWPVSDVPIAGAVAYVGGNHVAYVKEVRADGMVVLEEYNYVPHEYSSRVIAPSSVAAFLYPPPR